jgi:hypothetical protein
MNKIRFSGTTVFILLVSWVVLFSEGAVLCAQSSPVAWKRIWGSSDKANDSIVISSVSPSLNEVWVLGTSEMVNQRGGWDPAEFFLWFITPTGERKVVPLALLQRTLGNDFLRLNVRTILALDDGKVLVVVQGAEKVALARLNYRGEVESEREMEDLSGTIIRKILPAIGGGFYLVGNNGAYGLAVKLASDGSTVWQKTLDKVRPGEFVDALTVRDGGLVLISNIRGNGTGRPRSFWIGKLDSAGEVILQKFKLGEFGSVAENRTTDQIYIINNQGTTESQDVRINVLDSTLQDIKEMPVTTGGMGMTHFYLVALQSNEIVTAGTRYSKIWLKKFDVKGQEKWKFEGTWDDDMLVCAGLEPLGAGVVVFSPIIKLTSQSVNANKIGVMKLQMD